MEQQLGNSGHTSKLLIGVEVQKFLTLVRFDQHGGLSREIKFID